MQVIRKNSRKRGIKNNVIDNAIDNLNHATSSGLKILSARDFSSITILK